MLLIQGLTCSPYALKFQHNRWVFVKRQLTQLIEVDWRHVDTDELIHKGEEILLMCSLLKLYKKIFQKFFELHFISYVLDVKYQSLKQRFQLYSS